ncbi:MAG: hypothetical protein EOO04_38410, partial [Chitinophagaceae bacterium]
MTKKMTFVVKDGCGNLKYQAWESPEGFLPYIKEVWHNLGCYDWDLYPRYYGFNDPTVCLYKADGTLVACKTAPGNYTGGALTNFFALPYGDYYVIVQDACSRDSMFKPSLESFGGSQIDPFGWDCNKFNMHVDGPPPPQQFYIDNPGIYNQGDSICLYEYYTNTLIGCKPNYDSVTLNPRTGEPWASGAAWFDLPYGRYYAYIFDPCLDTTFKIDSVVTYPFAFESNLSPHCSVNQWGVSVSFLPEAKAPYTVKVLYPDGSTAINATYTQPNTYSLYNTWPSPGTLTVIGSDGCGYSDTSYIYQTQITAQRTVRTKGGCPGIYGVSGGGDIILEGNPFAY